MPELPEAETIVRGLRRSLRGREIRKVEVLHSDLLGEPPNRFRGALAGRTFGSVRRRGKNLVLELRHAASPPRYLVVNLGMSGRLLLRPANPVTPDPTHPGIRLSLSDGGVLVYDDVRRFGRLRVFDAPALRRWGRTLGPEPLGVAFTAERLYRDLAGSASPVRSWLLDQGKVAGIGNIYANEALFLALLHPMTPASRIDEESARALHGAIRSVLREAIRAKGTTLRDYRTALGREGSYGDQLRVYGREGLPCPRCGTPVRRIAFGGRSAFHCPRCQRAHGGGCTP